MNIALLRTILILAGAGGGFAYYYFIGCASGTCPISSNPWISTAYGALIGALVTSSVRRKPDGGAANKR